YTVRSSPLSNLASKSSGVIMLSYNGSSNKSIVSCFNESLPYGLSLFSTACLFFCVITNTSARNSTTITIIIQVMLYFNLPDQLSLYNPMKYKYNQESNSC